MAFKLRRGQQIIPSTTSPPTTPPLDHADFNTLDKLHEISDKLDLILTTLNVHHKHLKEALVVAASYKGTDYENVLCLRNAKMISDFLKKHNYNTTLLTDVNVQSITDVSSTLSLYDIMKSATVDKDTMPRKDIILEHIKQIVSTATTESVFIYFSGVGFTYTGRTKNNNIFIPIDSDIYGIISIDMILDIIKEYNLKHVKVILMFDCCINTKSTDDTITHYGLTHINALEDNNIIIFSSSLSKSHDAHEDIGLLTHLFIRKYVYRIAIKDLLNKMKTYAKHQRLEVASAVDESCKLSL
jgi:hypothetical protein